jgi:HSP20 family protein
MSLIRYRPVDPFESLFNLQTDVLRAFGSPRRVEVPLNVRASEDGYHVRIEIPGTRPEDLVVESRDGVLRIAIQTAASEDAEKGVAFSRSVRLPNDADAPHAEAAYVHGVLTVDVPKREEAKPRQIEVRVS